MYAHQVIEELTNSSSPYVKECMQYLPYIEHYHMGDVDNIFDLTRNASLDEVRQYIKLPHDVCWFDCQCLTKNRKGDLVCKKIGFHVAILDKFEPDQLFITLFIHVKKDNAKEGYWTYYKYATLMSADRQTRWIYDISEHDIKAINYDDIKDEITLQTLSYSMSIIARFLVLLNCKNIVPHKIFAPKKLNQKRQRNNKPAISEYYVLNLRLPSKEKNDYRSISTPLSHNRIHLCRGHFKTYTKEHPLLGRHTGLYWWQPHIRGQNKEGIILKDYKLAGGNHA